MPSASAAPSPVLQVTKRIAHAAILTLPTVPVTILPAPAANQMIVPIHAIAAFSRVADYANFAATGQLFIGPGTLAGLSLLTYVDETIASTGPSVLLGNGESEMMVFAPLTTISAGVAYPRPPANTPEGLVGQSLKVAVSNGASGNYTGGDPANLLVVTVTYFVLAWPT